jgi:hypothetical protein
MNTVVAALSPYGSLGGSLALDFFLLVLGLVAVAGMWKVFEKAGEPGWAAIVPIYNVVVLLKICGRPLWWIILFFVPFVSFIMWFVICFDVAKRFGKGAGFAIGLAILPFIFFPMLAWGDAKYQPAPAMA